MEAQAILGMVNINLIEPLGNVRVGKVKVDSELVKSIKAVGLLNPLTVREDPERQIYELISGNRRFAALKKIHGKADFDVAVSIITATNEELTKVQSHENIHRQDMNLLDMVSLVVTMTNDGMNQKQIAVVFGKTVAWVRNFGMLANLHPVLLKALNESDDYKDFLEDAVSIASYSQKTQETLLEEYDFIESYHWSDAEYTLRSQKLTLDRAPFDITLTECEGKSCVGCEFRTDDQLGMFAEYTEPSVTNPCYDEACYREKYTAFIAELTESLGVPQVDQSKWHHDVKCFTPVEFHTKARGVKGAIKNAIAFDISREGEILLRQAAKATKAEKETNTSTEPGTEPEEEKGLSNSSQSKWRTFVVGYMKEYLWEHLIASDIGLTGPVAHMLFSTNAQAIGDVCMNHRKHVYTKENWLSFDMMGTMHNLRIAVIRNKIVEAGRFSELVELQHIMVENGIDVDINLELLKEWTANKHLRETITALFTKGDLEPFAEMESSAKKGDYVAAIAEIPKMPMVDLLTKDHEWKSQYVQHGDDFLSAWYNYSTITEPGFALVHQSKFETTDVETEDDSEEGETTFAEEIETDYTESTEETESEKADPIESEVAEV